MKDRVSQIILTVSICLFIASIITYVKCDAPKDDPAEPVLTHMPLVDKGDDSDSIIAFILKEEGGYNPDDPSYEGVYQPTWDQFRKIKSDRNYPSHVKDLMDKPELVQEFYHWYLYELRSGVSVVPGWFKLMLADFWTTSMSQAIRPLQARAGVDIDGVWGHNTEYAVMQMFNSLGDNVGFARWYTDNRKEFYRSAGYGVDHPLMHRAEIVYTETLKRIRGDVPLYERTITDPSVQPHTPLDSLSLEDRISRLESLLMRQ